MIQVISEINYYIYILLCLSPFVAKWRDLIKANQGIEYTLAQLQVTFENVLYNALRLLTNLCVEGNSFRLFSIVDLNL